MGWKLFEAKWGETNAGAPLNSKGPPPWLKIPFLSSASQAALALLESLSSPKAAAPLLFKGELAIFNISLVIKRNLLFKRSRLYFLSLKLKKMLNKLFFKLSFKMLVLNKLL